MDMKPAALALALAVSPPALAQEAQLPPGHPPLSGGAAPARSAPPLDLSKNPSLPPGHPPMNAGAAALPPGHPPASGEAGQLMQKLDAAKDLEAREKTFEVAQSLGRLYYANARYADAQRYLAQAQEKAAPARALLLAEQKRASKVPPPESVGCARTAESTLEGLYELAKRKAAASDHPGAAACARAAVQPLVEVEVMLGQALFINREPGAALAAFERALEVSPSNADALYGRSALLLDTRGDEAKSLKTARAGFAQFLHDYPTAPRAAQAKAFLARIDEALAAGGLQALAKKEGEEARKRPPPAAPQNPPALTQEMMDAVRNTEQGPEMEAGYRKLLDEAEEHLAQSRFQEALDNYKRVVPFQPENGRAKAGMAWSLVGLDKQPMADRVWMVAVQADPAAVDQLGDALKAKGNPAAARSLWARLKQSAPQYAASAKLDQKLQ